VRINQALAQKLDEIELELARLIGPAPQYHAIFLNWMQDSFLRSQRRQMTESFMIWPIKKVCTMTQIASDHKPDLKKLLSLVQQYSDCIATDINISRPPAPSQGDLRSLLFEIESEMKAIGYWTEVAPCKYDLDDPRFLFPDRYLQYILIPHEQSRIQTNDLSDEALHGIMAFSHGGIWAFLSIPKARRLVDLLVFYMREVSKTVPCPFLGPDRTYEIQPKYLWLVTVKADVIHQAFEKQYQSFQPSIKIKGFARGQAPLSALREKVQEPTSNYVRSELTSNLQNIALKNNVYSDIICTLDSTQEDKELNFFLTGTTDLRTIRGKLPGYEISEPIRIN
jgi:hypothetical protein